MTTMLSLGKAKKNEMTYSQDVKKLMAGIGYNPIDRAKDAWFVRPKEMEIKPLTQAEREEVENNSYAERGWRVFKADRMTAI